LSDPVHRVIGRPKRADTTRVGRVIRTREVFRLRRAGFTLVEVLVVVVVLAIAALIVIPGAGDARTTKLVAAARLLVADLEVAQLRSVGNSADPCVVVFDPSGTGYHLAAQSDPGTPIEDLIGGTALQTTFGTARAAWIGGVTVASVSLDGDETLGFTSVGALDQQTPATITLQCGSSTLRIEIDPVTGSPAVNW